MTLIINYLKAYGGLISLKANYKKEIHFQKKKENWRIKQVLHLKK